MNTLRLVTEPKAVREPGDLELVEFRATIDGLRQRIEDSGNILVPHLEARTLVGSGNGLVASPSAATAQALINLFHGEPFLPASYVVPPRFKVVIAAARVFDWDEPMLRIRCKQLWPDAMMYQLAPIWARSRVRRLAAPTPDGILVEPSDASAP